MIITRKSHRAAIGIGVLLVATFVFVFGLRAAFGPEAGWAAPAMTIPLGGVIGWWIAGPS